jgi:hypothetical protein
MKNTISKRTQLLVAAAILITAGAAGGLWAMDKEPAPKPAAAVTEQKEQEQVTHITYEGEEGKNALDLLKENADAETKDSSYGPYVDSIGGVKGGTDGKYWTFYINGEAATVGAGAYITKEGDTIEWKFQ